MARVSNDDAAFRLPAIWLGPPGARLPESRMQTLLVWAAVTMVIIWLGYLFSPAGTHLHLVIAGFSWLIAVPITRKVMKHVDFDQPLRWVAGVVVDEVTTPRPLSDEPVTYVTGLSPKFRAPGRTPDEDA